MTKLCEAINNNNLQEVQALLKDGANPNEIGDQLCTPLLLTVNGPPPNHPSNGYEMMAALIAYNADVNLPSTDGWVPILWASSNGYFDQAKLLLENGAQVNKPNPRYSVTAVFLASQDGHNKVLNLLLSYKANPNIADFKGIRPLAIALINHHADTANILIEAGGYISLIQDETKKSKDPSTKTVKITQFETSKGMMKANNALQLQTIKTTQNSINSSYAFLKNFYFDPLSKLCNKILCCLK